MAELRLTGALRRIAQQAEAGLGSEREPSRVSDVLCDLGVDSVARVDDLPRPDDKVWVEPEGDYPGGMVGNCVATIVRQSKVRRILNLDLYLNTPIFSNAS